MIRGRFCENDAALTLSVPAAHATYPRIDRVVVRLNASPGRTIDIVVKAGTAAPEPAAPALTRTAEIWELSLAQVRVEAGATSILSAKITDERGSASLCGVAAPVYVPSSQVEVVSAMNMQGHALTGLPAPSGATDAATKTYVDSATVPKLSQLVMDADKNCNGRNFTNLGYITANKIRPVASTEVRASGKTSYTIPAVYTEGTVLIKAQALAQHVGTVKINGVVAFTWGPSDGGAWVEKIWPITGGDVVTFHSTTSAGCSISCSDTAPVAYPAPPTW
jgi:hypothetical protein